jgi:hypothetical protein
MTPAAARCRRRHDREPSVKDDASFFRDRIVQSDRDIAAATLANVRDQAVRARARWVELAERHERALAERAKVIAEKAARDAAASAC